MRSRKEAIRKAYNNVPIHVQDHTDPIRWNYIRNGTWNSLTSGVSEINSFKQELTEHVYRYIARFKRHGS